MVQLGIIFKKMNWNNVLLKSKKRIKVFSYAYQDMLGLDTSIIVHHLTLPLDAKQVNKKPHCMHNGKALLVKSKLHKILDTKCIEAIAYP